MHLGRPSVRPSVRLSGRRPAQAPNNKKITKKRNKREIGVDVHSAEITDFANVYITRSNVKQLEKFTHMSRNCRSLACGGSRVL